MIEERYLSDEEERLEQERINKEERLEALTQCVKNIAKLIKEKPKDFVSEIEYEIKSLE